MVAGVVNFSRPEAASAERRWQSERNAQSQGPSGAAVRTLLVRAMMRCSNISPKRPSRLEYQLLRCSCLLLQSARTEILHSKSVG